MKRTISLRILLFVVAGFTGGCLGHWWESSETGRQPTPDRSHFSVLSPRAASASAKEARFESIFTTELSESKRLLALANWKASEDSKEWWRILEMMDPWADADPVSAALIIPRLIEKMVDADASGNFQLLWQRDDLRKREELLCFFLDVWAKADLPAAIEALKAFPKKGRLAERLAGAIVDAAAREHPGDAVRLIVDYQLNFGDGSNRYSDYPERSRFERAFAGLARTDPELAAEEALRLVDPFQRVNALRHGLEVWAEADAQAALAFLEKETSLPESHHQHLLEMACIRGMARGDPLQALAFLQNHQDEEENFPYKDFHFIDEVLQVWASSDPAAASAEMQRLGLNLPAAAAKIAETWAREEPQEALKWARGLEEASRQEALGRIGLALAKSHPASALRINAEADQSPALRQIISEELTRDWNGTLQLVETIEDPSQRAEAALVAIQYAYINCRPIADEADRLFQFVADGQRDFSHLSYVVADGFDRPMIDALKRYPDLYQKTLPSIVESNATKDPQWAATLVHDFAHPEKQEKAIEAIKTLMHQWAARSPEQAALWLAESNMGSVEPLAYGALAETWGRFNLPRAKDWVESLPETESKSAAESGLERPLIE